MKNNYNNNKIELMIFRVVIVEKAFYPIIKINIVHNRFLSIELSRQVSILKVNRPVLMKQIRLFSIDDQMKILILVLQLRRKHKIHSIVLV